MWRSGFVLIVSAMLMGACQCNAPPISVELTPVKACNPTTYPSIPNVTALFEDTEGERVCLTLIFQHDTREIRAFAPALLAKDGTMVGYDSNTKTFTGSVKLSNPKEVFEDAKTNPWKVSMRLYFLAHNTDKTGRQEAHLEFCKKTGIKDYQCPSPTEPSCWFSMQVPPGLPKDSAYKLETTTTACVACVPEVCGNQKDDDCDGLTDDADPECSTCTAEETRPCFTVAPAERNVGFCKDGTQTCGADSKWGKCEGETKGKAELCNGIDDDCDGKSDEDLKDCCELGVFRSCYTGLPQDAGKGICEHGTEICLRQIDGSGKWSGNCIGGTRTPEVEVCNSIDDNCDGMIDEGLVRLCYRGDPGTQKIGECKEGKQLCQFNGQWGNCQGDTQPVKEVCDGKDNDCDGEIDEDLTKADTLCTIPNEKGPCANGILTACVMGVATCQPTFSKETKETCNNGIDDNCDGEIDEGCFCTQDQDCYNGPPDTAGKGACQKGTQTCTGGKLTACTGEVLPTTELCNDIDDDCDGTIDEDLDRPCYSGSPGTLGNGPCKEGTESCKDGKWSACKGEITPKPEGCNKADDNCDGNVDETCVCQPDDKEPCYSGPVNTANISPCKSGERICDGKGQWGPCEGEVLPQAEDCNKKDNDCNGQIDDVQQACYTGDKKTRGIGLCKDGIQLCVRGNWGRCTNEVKPRSSDRCDNFDEDCDGKIENDCNCKAGATTKCYGGLKSTVNVGPCRFGTQTCESKNKWGACTGSVVPQPEACDAIDNDCNGQIDDKLQRPCYNGPSNTKQNLPCKEGAETCSNGQWGSCVGEVNPSAEGCNGLDDDCDGKVDNVAGSSDSLSRTCYAGPPNTEGKGICKAGKETCNAGRWGACVGQIIPNAERCNKVDDNCDGTIDEPGVRCGGTNDPACPSTYSCPPGIPQRRCACP